MKDVQEFMRLIQQGPPKPEFLVKALAHALYELALSRSRAMGPPETYLAQMEAAGYSRDAAQSIFRHTIDAALGRTDDQVTTEVN